MKPELKDLMQELQVAFNESVCESDRIAEVLAEIKSSGYDVLLALEVTIGMNVAKPSEADPEPAPPVTSGSRASCTSPTRIASSSRACTFASNREPSRCRRRLSLAARAPSRSRTFFPLR